jgi:RNA:NAD 2'-phosphotransferase (TPT1/KptA family)
MKPVYVMRSESLESLLQEGLEREKKDSEHNSDAQSAQPVTAVNTEEKTVLTIQSELTEISQPQAQIPIPVSPIEDQDEQSPVDFVIYHTSSFLAPEEDTKKKRKKNLVHVSDQENKNYTVGKFSWK